jgi:hypothetical protein
VGSKALAVNSLVGICAGRLVAGGVHAAMQVIIKINMNRRNVFMFASLQDPSIHGS